MPNISAFFAGTRKSILIALSLGVLCLVGFIDYVTGNELSVSTLYLLAVFIITWYVGRIAGVIFAGLSAMIAFVSNYLASPAYSRGFIAYWNMMINFTLFLVFAVTLSRLKSAYERKAKLVGELETALADLKRAEEDLEQQKEALARSNKELEQFAYIAAHDLKSPLIAIEGYIQRLRRLYRDRMWDDNAEGLIGHVMEGIQKMRVLINDLLAYARIGSAKKELSAVDCNAAVEAAVANLRSDIEGSGATVTYDLLPGLSACNTQIVELFQNLISNGIKFRGGERPAVHISVEESGEDWIFSVRDNGIGIDSSNAERIFDMFQRLHSDAKYPGTGIGLAVCKKIVENLNGRIWVESAAGRGSIFHFAIPKDARR